jgi:hypothetical protein
MSVIHKFCLLDSRHDVMLPEGATILSAQAQEKTVTVWYEAPSAEAPKTVKRQFRMVTTGNPFQRGDRDVFIGTVQLGWFVAHIYEVANG